VRAKRRYLEKAGRGEATPYEAVLADILRRDERDATRDAAPMRPASDAVLLDTSNLDIEAAFDTAVGVILRKIGQRGHA
jgi:cytidylate kinase